jgi:heat shock protein HtpX
MSHIKHRDMAIITLLSAIPMILYWVAIMTMYGGFSGGSSRRKNSGNYALLIGIGALIFYFITNLLVLYGSRIREYYADKGSVELGNQPNQLATALYKLVNSSANIRDKNQLKKVEGAKAFFISDPMQSMNELRELSQIDKNKDGVIDQYELLTLRQMNVKLSFWAKFGEIFTTHPNMLKRIKQLASYTA